MPQLTLVDGKVASGQTWTWNVGPAERIPLGEGRNYLVGATMIAVFRTRAGEIFATQASCPHREGPLADGIVGEGHVVCPLHAFKFELRDGRAKGHDCGDLATYPVRLSDGGDVIVDVPVS